MENENESLLLCAINPSNGCLAWGERTFDGQCTACGEGHGPGGRPHAFWQAGTGNRQRGGMSQMFLYNFLDIVSTIMEALILYVIAQCFYKRIRTQNIVSRFLPIVLYGALVAVLTHFSDLGAIKLFLLLTFIVLMLKLFYRISFHEGFVVMEMYYLAVSMIPESAGMCLMRLFLNGGILTEIDGTLILRWQVYVAIMLIRCAVLALACWLLKDFSYKIQRKDTVVLTVSFLLAFSVFFASTYGYLNLQDGISFPLDLITSVLCACFIVQFFYFKNAAYVREQEQRDKMQIAQLQQQYDYYREKRKDEERVRSIYHDLKNHLLVLEGRQGTEETRRMAEKLRLQIADYEDYVHTGNDFLDIILKDKAAKAREKQIPFSASVDFRGIDFLDPLDISTIFGNAIDNAIEAGEKMPEEERLITVKAGRVRDLVSIVVENNFRFAWGRLSEN